MGLNSVQTEHVNTFSSTRVKAARQGGRVRPDTERCALKDRRRTNRGVARDAGHAARQRDHPGARAALHRSAPMQSRVSRPRVVRQCGAQTDVRREPVATIACGQLADLSPGPYNHGPTASRIVAGRRCARGCGRHRRTDALRESFELESNIRALFILLLLHPPGFLR